MLKINNEANGGDIITKIKNQRKKRSRNTPKAKPIEQINFEPDFSGAKRTACKTCYENNGTIRYMDILTKQFRTVEDPDKTKRVRVQLCCFECRNIYWNEEGIKKIPK